jgi:hypothetical protein
MTGRLVVQLPRVLTGRCEGSAFRAGCEHTGLRFNADAVVDRSTDSLLAAKISFGCLHGNVSKKELDLVQFSPGRMAQLSA